MHAREKDQDVSEKERTRILLSSIGNSRDFFLLLNKTAAPVGKMVPIFPKNTGDLKREPREEVGV